MKPFAARAPIAALTSVAAALCMAAALVAPAASREPIPGAAYEAAASEVNSAGALTGTLEWSWSLDPSESRYLLPQTAPAVMDLDRDGVPEVVFAAARAEPGAEDGVLRAIRGASGAPFWEAEEPVFATSAPAVGDLDGDGRIEVVSAAADGRHVLAFDDRGDLLWRSGELPQYLDLTPLSIADLDGDGTSEIIAGLSVLEHDGRVRWWKDHPTRLHTLAVDLDDDGRRELVDGSQAFRGDGAWLWTNRDIRGLASAAVGNFDVDTDPEIVASVVVGASVILIDNGGSTIWGPVELEDDIANLGGGPPVVGDLDGDGWPEIGVGTSRSFTVLDRHGDVRWRRASANEASGVGAASLFDFDADGALEVVFQDEAGLYVLDGQTGSVRWEQSIRTHVFSELPIVADVDGDGAAEIVANSNSPHMTETQGIYIFGSATDPWPPARPVWNQHAYHVDNVADDGTLPRLDLRGWLSHNTFRANVGQGVVPPTATATEPPTSTPVVEPPSATPSPVASEEPATPSPPATETATATVASTLDPPATASPSATVHPEPTPSIEPQPTPSTLPTPVPTVALTPDPPATVAPSPPSEPGTVYLPLVVAETCPPRDVFTDVVLVLDASTSMLETASSGERKLDIAVRAGARLVDAMRLGAGRDRVAIVAFNERAHVLRGLTGERALLVDALERIEVAQQSRIDLGIRTASGELVRRGGTGRTQALIVLTDGRVNPVGPDRVRQASAEARRLGARVVAVAMGDRVDGETLAAIASEEGLVRRASEPRFVEAIFGELAMTIPCPEAYYWPRRR